MPLLNGQVEDTTEHVAVPSVLRTPEWVTPENMKTTVIEDHFVPPSQLCAAPYADAAGVQGAGITP